MNNLMVKLFIVLTVFSLTKSVAQNNKFYDLKFKSINNTLVSMASFSGKKVLVEIFDASNVNRDQLKSLDTLQRNNQNELVVIAIPVSDFGKPIPETQLKKLLSDTLQVSYLVTPVSKAQKNSGIAQHVLLSYLTDKNQNTNFDIDVDNTDEQFIISEKGKLFARFKESIPINGFAMSKFLSKQGM